MGTAGIPLGGAHLHVRGSTLRYADVVTRLTECDQDALVSIRLMHHDGSLGEPTNPGKITSWRGRYDEPSLTRDGDAPRTVGDLATAMRTAVGTTVEACKGGLYAIDDDAPLWLDNECRCESYVAIAVMESPTLGVVIVGACVE